MHAGPGRGPHLVVYVLSRTARAVQLQARIEKSEEAVYSGEAARQFDFNRVRAIMVSDGAGGTQTPNMLIAKPGAVPELARIPDFGSAENQARPGLSS